MQRESPLSSDEMTSFAYRSSASHPREWLPGTQVPPQNGPLTFETVLFNAVLQQKKPAAEKKYHV